MKDKMKYINLKIWIFPIAMLICASAAFPFLPDEIPRQWDSYGNVANIASKWIVFLPPLVCAFILIRGNIIPFIDPKTEGYGHIRKEYSFIHFMIMCVMLFGEVYMILSGFGVQIPFGVKWFWVAIGIFFIFVGNILPKIPPTYLTGVKTVWAYGDDELWTKTQRFSAKVWVIGGFILAFEIFLPGYIMDSLTLVFVISLVVLPRLYSMLQHNLLRKYKSK